ncbi:hypothetical protein PCE1_003506 [Barthelona sp. PCE]
MAAFPYGFVLYPLSIALAVSIAFFEKKQYFQYFWLFHIGYSIQQSTTVVVNELLFGIALVLNCTFFLFFDDYTLGQAMFTLVLSYVRMQAYEFAGKFKEIMQHMHSLERSIQKEIYIILSRFSPFHFVHGLVNREDKGNIEVVSLKEWPVLCILFSPYFPYSETTFHQVPSSHEYPSSAVPPFSILVSEFYLHLDASVTKNNCCWFRGHNMAIVLPSTTLQTAIDSKTSIFFKDSSLDPRQVLRNLEHIAAEVQASVPHLKKLFPFSKFDCRMLLTSADTSICSKKSSPMFTCLDLHISKYCSTFASNEEFAGQDCFSYIVEREYRGCYVTPSLLSYIDVHVTKFGVLEFLGFLREDEQEFLSFQKNYFSKRRKSVLKNSLGNNKTTIGHVFGGRESLIPKQPLFQSESFYFRSPATINFEFKSLLYPYITMFTWNVLFDICCLTALFFVMLLSNWRIWNLLLVPLFLVFAIFVMFLRNCQTLEHVLMWKVLISTVVTMCSVVSFYRFDVSNHYSEIFGVCVFFIVYRIPSMLSPTLHCIQLVLYCTVMYMEPYLNSVCITLFPAAFIAVKRYIEHEAVILRISGTLHRFETFSNNIANDTLMDFLGDALYPFIHFPFVIGLSGRMSPVQEFYEEPIVERYNYLCGIHDAFKLKCSSLPAISYVRFGSNRFSAIGMRRSFDLKPGSAPHPRSFLLAACNFDVCSQLLMLGFSVFDRVAGDEKYPPSIERELQIILNSGSCSVGFFDCSNFEMVGGLVSNAERLFLNPVLPRYEFLIDEIFYRLYISSISRMRYIFKLYGLDIFAEILDSFDIPIEMMFTNNIPFPNYMHKCCCLFEGPLNLSIGNKNVLYYRVDLTTYPFESNILDQIMHMNKQTKSIHEFKRRRSRGRSIDLGEVIEVHGTGIGNIS